VTDDYASLTDHLDGMDPHGIPPTDAAQLAANAMHVNGANPAVGPAWKSEQAFKNRSSKAIAALRQHIVSVPLQPLEVSTDFEPFLNFGSLAVPQETRVGRAPHSLRCVPLARALHVTC